MARLYRELFRCVTGGALLTAQIAFAQATFQFDLPAQPLADSLRAVGRITHTNVLFDPPLVDGLRAPALKASLTPDQAFTRLLTGTLLKGKFLDDTTVTIARITASAAPPPLDPPTGGRIAADEEGKTKSSNGFRMAQVDQGTPSGDSSVEKEQASKKKPVQFEEYRVSLPEVLVVGSKVLNMDIKRSRDDAQPYVIFDRTTIEQSGATTIEDFLKQRLTMNTEGITFGQTGGSASGSISQINLRGLGPNQTLVLVDGHRTASAIVIGAGPQQADINGIPLAAVERIEVLPTTASGIYGGGATGGVVNIILRRDYTGTDLKVAYENSFDKGGANRRVDLTTGFNLEGGKTNVLLAGSYSDANALAVGDRDFIQRGRAAILANNPGFFTNAFFPPLGATTNIRSLNGSPLFGPGTPNFTSVPVGYAGGGGMAPLQANAGQYNLDLPNSAQLGAGRKVSLLNGPTIKSLTATLRREFTPELQVFLDAGASDNTGHGLTSGIFSSSYVIPQTAPNNPFGQAIRATVPVASADRDFISAIYDRRLVGGFILKLPHDWKIEADYTWDRNRNYFSQPPRLTPAASAAVRNGTLDVLRDTNAFPVDFSPYLGASTHSEEKSTLEDAVVRIGGPAWSLPTGSLSISGSLEHRLELIGAADVTISVFDILFPSMSQSVDSVYLEAKLPLIGAQNHIPGIQELELQLAGRHDEYTVKGATSSVLVGIDPPASRANDKVSSTNPTVGLRYQAVPDLMLRASYGTGLLPPSVEQVVGGTAAIPGGLATDPRRGNESTDQLTQEIFGGNSALRPEKSKSWSAGVVFTPRALTGLRLSVDYTHIRKTDNISQFQLQDIINNESLFPGRVVRGPVPPGDPFGVGPITLVDLSLVNISRALVEAYDAALDYDWATATRGRFEFFALGTWQTHYQTQLLPGQPIVENVGIGNINPLRLKANAGLTWKYRSWALGWVSHYFDSYIVSTDLTTILNQGSSRIPSQTYHDAFARWSSSADVRSTLFSNTEVQVGVKNVFNTRPPLDQSFGFALYSPFGDPRLASYYVQVKKGF